MSTEIADPILKTSGPSLFKFISWAREGKGSRIAPILRVMDAYGDISLLRIGTRRLYFLNHPDIIQECLVSKHKHFNKASGYFGLRLVMGMGLVTSEGEFHHRQRRMIQPAFHRDRVNEYAKVMGQYAHKMCGEWKSGEEIDINRAMMRVTLNIVGKALFNSDVDSEAGMVGSALDTLMVMDAVFVNPFGPLIAKLPLPINKRRLAATAQLDGLIYKMIAEHRATGDQGDLLSMLLAAQDEEDGGRMTDLQVRDEAVTLFLAGHETTANGLTWTWMLLSQHPEIEAKVHEEVDRVLAGRVPVGEDFPKLEYTRRVFAESMRLYPPVWGVGRRSNQDTTLGGHFIPNHSEIMISQFAIHRDKRYWDDPMCFDPDRWAPEKAKERHKFSYFPFGGGNRLCIGEGFSWMEGVLVLAAVAQHFKLRLRSDFKEELDPHITLRPKRGMPMIVEART